MSVSQSSIYEQTPALKQIEHQIQDCLETEVINGQKLKPIIENIQQLSISQSYRLIAILSKNLKNNSSVVRKYLSLLLAKELVLSGYHRFYIFSSIRILPWIVNIANFQARKSEHERIKAYLNQLSIGGNGEEVTQQRYCFKLFKIISEFLEWFSLKLPDHLNCPFPYRSTFRRKYEQLSRKSEIKKFQYFSEDDFLQFQKNVDLLEAESTLDIKELTEFVAIELHTLVEKGKAKSDLLFQIVKTGDSYCIKAIISELRLLLEDASKLNVTVRFISYLMNTGEVQFIECFKIYCLPLILQYILPFPILEVELLKCKKETELLILDCLHLWSQITKGVQLSNSIYVNAFKVLQDRKKEVKKITLQQLDDFKTNLIDMKSINSDKFEKVQLTEKQNALIRVLKEGNQQKASKLDGSAINELTSFKESNISKNPFNQALNFHKSSSASGSISKSTAKQVTPKSPQHRNNQQFYDEKYIPKKIIAERPPPNTDSYIAFEPSKESKYAQISSSKSSESEEIRFDSSSEETSSKKSDPSVVYFNNSDSFDSVTESSKVASQQNLFGSLSFNDKNEKEKMGKDDKSSSSSNNSKFIQSTYEFDNSISSQSLCSESQKIVNFGTSGNNLPQAQKKPQFAFKKAKVSNDQEIKANKEKYEDVLDHLFSSHASVDKNSQKLPNFGRQHDISKTQKLKETIEGQNNLAGNHHHFEHAQEWQSEESNIKRDSNSPSVFSAKEIDLGESKFSEIYRRTEKNLMMKKEKQSRFQRNDKKKPLIIEEYNNDKVIELEREVGKAREQKLRKKQELRKKQKEYKLLKQKSDPALDSNMKQLRKQNQILELLLQQKNREESSGLRQIKPINAKNEIEDFFLENKVKAVYNTYALPYQHLFLKQILGTRCLLIRNESIQLGFNYSKRQNIVSLYLTLLKAFDVVEIKVIQNSIEFEKQIEMRLKNQPARSQLKIKRKVVSIKEKKKVPTFSEIVNENSTNVYMFPEIYISIHQETSQIEHFSSTIPCSLYNLCLPIEIDKQTFESLKNKKIIKTQKLLLNQQFLKNTKEKISKYFPQYMNLVGGWKIIGFQYPEEIFKVRPNQFFKFRINELKKIEFQFFGDPQSLLAETLVRILANTTK